MFYPLHTDAFAETIKSEIDLEGSNLDAAWKEKKCATKEQLDKFTLWEVPHHYLEETGTKTLLDKSTPIRLSLLGEYYDIPYGYFESQYLPEHLERREFPDEKSYLTTKWDQKKTTLVIWTDGTWPPFRPRRPIFRICDKPGVHRLRIHVENTIGRQDRTESIKGERPIYLKPSGRFKNRFGVISPEFRKKFGPISLDRAHGLFQMYWINSITNPNTSIYYKSLHTDERDVFGSCAGPHTKTIFRTCRFDIYWPDGLGLKITLLWEDLPRWEAIAEQAHTFFIKSKVGLSREKG